MALNFKVGDMTTGTVIVNDALSLINLNSDVLPAKPAHQQRGFKALVDMLKRMRGDGQRVVRQLPSAIGTDLHEPSWATEGLKFSLAMALAPYLRQTLTNEQMLYGEKAIKTLRNRASPPIACAMPDTLPRGSGNYEECYETFFNGRLVVDYDVYAEGFVGESATFYADFDYDADNRGTSVSSVAWTNLGSTDATISSTSLSGNVASAQLSFTSEGSVIVRARATYANAQIKDFLFNVEVTDLAYSPSA